MIVISFDAECVNQNTAPDIAGLSRDPRYCVGITGEMTEDQREILEAQHVPVRVGNETQMAPPLLLWSRPRGDSKLKTWHKIRQRIPQARRYLHVCDKPSAVYPGGDWWALTFAALAKELAAA